MRHNLNWVKGGSSEGKPGYLIEFEYSAYIVEQIKKTVPSSLREWNLDKKQWWISELAEAPLNRIFPGFLESVIAQKRLF